MRSPHVNDQVRLTQDVPELHLRQGDVGVVCSLWFAPAEAYEVEFVPSGIDDTTRALLLAEQLQVDESPPPSLHPPSLYPTVLHS